MNKRSIINKMILLSSISACALLFSCGKSETETKDEEGNTIEFENITSDEIEINRVGSWHKTYYITQDTYAISRTDSLANSSHKVTISYGIGDRLLNHIKEYENEVELFEKTQELKLSIFRICYANYQDFSIGQNIARNPYYNVYFNNLPDFEKKGGRNIETYIDGTNYEDYYSRVEVYSEINNLEYYFSDDFKYGKLEIIDNITKDDLKPFVKRDCTEEYGLLQYSFLLEPVDSDDEIIKYGRISDGSGNERTYTKNGIESVSWKKGDYAFPLCEANDGTVQVNRTALRMLTSYVSNCIPYVIEGNNVTFNTSKEVA
jgi:hypothetical protein